MKKLNQGRQFKTFGQILDALPTDEACREYLELTLWNKEPVCPHCGVKNKKHYKLKTKGEFKGLYKCKDCRARFTVLVGTMFEGSHIPLRKWFIAIYIFSSHKKGISSLQLSKDLGLTQKTAWFMLHRIRQAFNNKVDSKFTGVIQVDESFVGGKSKNKHNDKRIALSQGRSLKNKTPVLGMIINGYRVYTQVIPDTKGTTIKPIINDMVDQGAIIVTDQWRGYNGLSKNFKHVVLNHKNNEYVRGGFHNNTIENFWSHLKRGIYGIYHHTSTKHLHRYCHEFSYRYNTRKLKDNERFDLSLKNVNCQISYKELIKK